MILLKRKSIDYKEKCEIYKIYLECLYSYIYEKEIIVNHVKRRY